MSERKTVLSGIKSTGRSHLGNYFGAMKQFLALQELGHELFVFVADYHSLTSARDANVLREETMAIAIDYLAIGLDPDKTHLFRQSDIPEIPELSWILACVCPKGFLDRAHAFKDAKAKGEDLNAGTYTYPILMAADILAYGSHLVPVGKDQAQHVEYAQDLQGKFNHEFGEEVLVRPEPMIQSETGLILGPDGEKMSKSRGNVIELFEPVKSFEKKLKRIKTDSKTVEEPKDPDTCPVMTLYKLFDPEGVPALEEKYRAGGMGYGVAKQALIDATRAELDPHRERRAELEADLGSVEAVLVKGAEAARERAGEILGRVRRACGLD
ncbi:MAG: tryptophan--tRNA ligase [Acidobacteriota bacterium]